MNRRRVISKCIRNRKFILKNLKNPKSKKYILKDLAKLDKLQKEIEIQKCYMQHESS